MPAEAVEESEPTLVRNPVNRHAGTAQALEALAKKIAGPGEVATAIFDHEIDKARAAASNQKVDCWQRNPDVAVTLLAFPRRLRQGDLQAFDATARNRLRWRIGVGVHAIGSGQNTLEIGRSVRLRLSCFVRHTVERIYVAQLDFFSGGDGVLRSSPDHDQRIIAATVEAVPESFEFLLRAFVVGPFFVVNKSRLLIEAGDYPDPAHEFVSEGQSRLRRPT